MNEKLFELNSLLAVAVNPQCHWLGPMDEMQIPQYQDLPDMELRAVVAVLKEEIADEIWRQRVNGR